MDEIKNCLNYVAKSSDNFVNHLCEKCEDLFFLEIDNVSCTKNSVMNCAKSRDKEDLCFECVNKFYLDGDTCRPHDNISNCEIYESGIKNKCKKCNRNYLHFKQSSVCIKGNSIEDCEIYLNDSACSVCEIGFVLNSEKKCQLFEEDSKCIEINSLNKCVNCEEGYFRWSLTNKCTDILNYQSEYCQKFNITDDKIQCEECKNESYFISFNNFSVCLENDDLHIVNKVANCFIHFYVDEIIKCKECEVGFFLDPENNSCIKNCPETIILIDLSFDSSEKITLKKDKNICKNINQTECFYAIQTNEVSEENYICVKCKENHYPFFDYQSLNPILGQSHIVEIIDDKINYNILNQNHGVECGNPQNNNYNVENNFNPINNCEFYQKTEDPSIIFKCIKCKNGRTGVANNGFIETCEEVIEDCDDSIIYKNLILPSSIDHESNKITLQMLSSCSKCNNNKLPVIFLKNGSKLEIAPFSKLESIPHTIDQLPNNNLMKCLTLTHEDFSLQISQNFDSIPSNCGFILYYTQIEKSGDMLSDPSIVCAACKPGFKPVFTSSIIVNCEIIENCNFESILNVYYNRCASCISGFMWDWDSDSNSFDFQKCTGSLEPHCESFSSSDNKCKSCKTGYYLNIDSKCEKLQLANCQQNFLNFSDFSFSTTKIRLGVNLFKALENHGCSSCEIGYILFQFNDKICLESSYLKEGIFNPLTKFITNCKNYIMDNNTLKCQNCILGYIPKFNKLECISLTFSLESCLIAESETLCDECITNKVLIKGKCESPIIPNCEIYQADATVQTCQKCSKGFYLQDNSCLFGSILNCMYYNSQTTCQTCNENYQLVIIKNFKHYCYPIPIIQNCEDYSATFNIMNMNCQKCKSGYIKSTKIEDIVPYLCLNHNLISNCEEYNFENTLSNSSMNCMLCENGYFLDSINCEKRVNTDINCELYEQLEDYCQICKQGYYLSENKKNCIGYPKGIFGCIEYLSLETCIKCQSDYYLKENICEEIEEDRKIQNCQVHSEPLKCHECSLGFVIKNDECLPLIAQNCLTAKDENTCQTCPKNYGLKPEPPITNCVQKTDPNCVKFENPYPFKCQKCTIDYYSTKEEGICKSVNTPIKGCLEYIDSLTCSKCENNKVLSKLKDKCLSSDYLVGLIDKNCVNSFMELESGCETCLPGNYFDHDGVCVSCPENGISSGCFYCDYRDNGKCVLCTENYFMDQQGRCVLEAVEQVVEVETVFVFAFWAFFGVFGFL